MYTLSLLDPYFLPHVGCDISFSLENGKLLLLKGENGIGKSSLLRRLAEIYGSQYAFSVVDQDSFDPFYDRKLLKVKKIILGIDAQKLDREKFERLWNLFGLEEKGDRFISHLSGGEKQLVKLAVGVSVRAQVYFLDEPFQFLDRSKKDLLTSEITTLVQTSSVVMVEHSIVDLSVPMKTLTLKSRHNLIRGDLS